MRQIVMVCGILIMLLLATLGCLFIFGIMSMDSAASSLLKFGAAIVLLGGCAAAITLMMRKKEE
jgi:hypothetical protein